MKTVGACSKQRGGTDPDLTNYRTVPRLSLDGRRLRWPYLPRRFFSRRLSPAELPRHSVASTLLSFGPSFVIPRWPSPARGEQQHHLFLKLNLGTAMDTSNTRLPGGQSHSDDVLTMAPDEGMKAETKIESTLRAPQWTITKSPSGIGAAKDQSRPAVAAEISTRGAPSVQIAPVPSEKSFELMDQLEAL